VIERVIENWLIKANERSFQIPFCYILSKEGYTVVHISRHCGMELGKDIIAIAPDGVPCAFQLKSGNISLKKWQSEIVHQVQDLVLGTINHPSIDSKKTHRAYLVTNGKIEEEVSRAIDDLNRAWAARNQPTLNVIVGGELIKKAKDLQSDFWPKELEDIKTFLELYLENGKDVFPKSKFSNFLETLFPFKRINGKTPTKALCNRILASSAIFTTLILSSFTEHKNYVAEIEAWTIYSSYLFALVERWGLNEKYFKSELDIALKAIKNSLYNLVEEIKEKKYLSEGDITFDQPFYRVRITWLISFLAILGLWRMADKEEKEEVDDFIKSFIKANESKLLLWGEAAIPQFLSYYWFSRLTDATIKPDSILTNLINAICQNNEPNSVNPLPNPYYEAIDILPYYIDSQLDEFLPHKFRLTNKPLDVNFAGISYSLESIVHLFVRRNWKQTMKLLWPQITRIAYHKFQFENSWDFYRWRNEKGTAITILPKHRKSWNELKKQANNIDLSNLPNFDIKYVIWLILFLCVFPHRIDTNVVKFIDYNIRKIVY